MSNLKNLSPNMEFTITLDKLNDMVEKRARELSDQRMTEVNKKILENNLVKDGGKVYIIHEKDEDGFVIKTKFGKVLSAISYLSNKYNYELTRHSFDNLKKRLQKEPERKTKLDNIFRGKVVKIESIKKNP